MQQRTTCFTTDSLKTVHSSLAGGSLGQLGDVTPAACPGSSQQAEHETRPKGNLQGPCQPARPHKSQYIRSLNDSQTNMTAKTKKRRPKAK